MKMLINATLAAITLVAGLSVAGAAGPAMVTVQESSHGEPQAGAGVNAGALGSLKRPDGTMQVTYNGWPLYYFIKDKAPGDTMGQDVKGFSAEWYLVTPSGKEVHSK